MITQKLSIIGVGNMGSAIASCLLDKKTIQPSNLILYDPASALMEKIEKDGAVIAPSLESAVKQSEILLLAVKPQVFANLLPEIKKFIKKDQLIISIAAGIPLAYIKNGIGQNQQVIRVMPNLCAMVGESMSVWVKSSEVTSEQAGNTREILRSIGKEVFLDNENLIDAATAISGSGPAYYFYLTEMLEMNAREMGIGATEAGILARQTLIGSAKVIAQSSKTSKELRINVTSKGGTTEAAFETFDQVNLKAILKNGIRSAWRRAKELKG